MLTEQEQKMIAEALNKMSLDLQQVIKNQERVDFKIEAIQSEIKFLRSEVKAVDDKLDYKIEAVQNGIKGVDDKLSKVLDEQSKRITDIGTTKNFQQNWFLAIQTVLIGTVVTVLIKFGFFN